MIQSIAGRVIKLGDSVNTDIIAPGRWKSQGMEVLREHTMEAIRPGFSHQIRPGDILVAGRDFGCGSHREQATEVMQAMGISAIAADSVARLYFRNGIAFGLPVIAAKQVSQFAGEGDMLEIVMGEEAIVLRNLTAGTSMSAPPLPPVMQRVLEAGGIYGFLKEQKEKERRGSMSLPPGTEDSAQVFAPRTLAVPYVRFKVNQRNH